MADTDEDDGFEPVHKQQRSSRWKQWRPRKMTPAADEDLESLPKAFKLEPYEGEALYLYDMKLNRSKQKRSGNPTTKPNYRVDESDDTEEDSQPSQDDSQPSQDDSVLLENLKQRKRTKSNVTVSKTIEEEGDGESYCKLKVADYKPGERSERGKQKKLKFCEVCQQ